MGFLQKLPDLRPVLRQEARIRSADEGNVPVDDRRILRQHPDPLTGQGFIQLLGGISRIAAVVVLIVVAVDVVNAVPGPDASQQGACLLHTRPAGVLVHDVPVQQDKIRILGGDPVTLLRQFSPVMPLP